MDIDHKAHVIVLEGDEPVPILFWSPQEFMMMLAGPGIGIILEQMAFGVILGYVILKVSRYLRRGAKRGAMIHFLYSIGLGFAPLSTYFPPAEQNEFFR